jgi:hypothetical protein
MAQALIRSYPEGEANETARFCKLMNDFFDCLNVRAYNEATCKRNVLLGPYRSQDDKRFEWLVNTFLQYFHDWKNPSFLPTAQAKMFISQQTYEGLQITVHSTVETVKFLLSQGVDSVLTERFQQDPLEEYFGNQSQRGRRSDNPDASQLAYNDRALDVQRNIVPIKAGNTGKCSAEKSKWNDIIYNIIQDVSGSVTSLVITIQD